MISIQIISMIIIGRAAAGGRRSRRPGRPSSLGDSENTVRGYCLNIPRFEQCLNN